MPIDAGLPPADYPPRGPPPAPPTPQPVVAPAEREAIPYERPARPAYAALDLGTNNCRLLIARPTRDGFQVVDAFSRVVRLGEGLIQTGLLSDASQERAVAALSVCADKMRRRGVVLARSVATEACRRAGNTAGFVERVFRETGIALDVITPAEEARLAVLGCQTLIDRQAEQALVFDIGGGSTEVVAVERRGRGFAAVDWISVPWGVVSLAETELDPLDTACARLDAFARMRARVAEHIVPFRARVDLEPGTQLLGASGTVTTLASVHLGLPAYDRRQVDGCWVPAGAMRGIARTLAGQSVAERAEHPCIGHERAELVVAGCAILDALLDSWPVERLRVADRGIREGILRTLMTRDGAWW